MLQRHIIFILLIFTLLVTVSATEKVSLVRDGKPVSAIILPARATSTAQFSAMELRHHIKMISGAKLPIIKEGEPFNGFGIYVGETDFARKNGSGARFPAGGIADQVHSIRRNSDRGATFRHSENRSMEPLRTSLISSATTKELCMRRTIFWNGISVSAGMRRPIQEPRSSRGNPLKSSRKISGRNRR